MLFFCIVVDDNKFGQRLLEKMGWKEGCGLGAKLQGPVEHIKVTFKNDSKGMGFKEGSEEWTEHQSNFDSLLTQLNGGIREDQGVTSLEQVSQRSRARLHYKKFTRGKDLSRASAKDLLCILGPAKAEAGEECGKITNNRGVITIQGGSMEDYFKKKLGNKRKVSNDHLETDNLTETWQDCSKKRKLEDINVCDGNGDRNETLSDEIKHKKRKSRENTLICLDTKVDDGANNVDSHHRKKKSVEAGNVKKGSIEAREVLQTDEIEILPRKVKKKKHHKKIADSEEKEDKAPNCNDISGETNHYDFNVSKTKHKKHKKEKLRLVEKESCTTKNENIFSETLICKSFEEEEIHQKENNNENILENNIETVEQEISDTEQSTFISALIKKSKKKKKSKKEKLTEILKFDLHKSKLKEDEDKCLVENLDCEIESTNPRNTSSGILKSSKRSEGNNKSTGIVKRRVSFNLLPLAEDSKVITLIENHNSRPQPTEGLALAPSKNEIKNRSKQCDITEVTSNNKEVENLNDGGDIAIVAFGFKGSNLNSIAGYGTTI
uniref:G-patch domain-containing protein n=1 Tax=Timema douglasi TaxID=61478 RepID=A0A7R8ZDP1_TIMDO|nr:unnamed protein product [Timema douglasi]